MSSRQLGATTPLLLRPYYVAKPWGGRRLESVLGRSDLPAGPIGESWEVGTIDEWDAVVDGGEHDGRSLRGVWGGPFPLLVKVIDAKEHLSVQVHPDGRDGVAAKEEAWVALSDEGEVAVGTLSGEPLPEPGAWLDRLERRALAAARGDVAPSVIHVPPGTVHAILADALVWEVQTPVQVTWRLDDHGRVGLDGQPRDLHLETARTLLARGSEPLGRLTADGRCLEGRRLALAAHPPGRWEAAGRHLVLFAPAGAELDLDGGAPFLVPPGRTVILPPDLRAVRSDGWLFGASPTQVDGDV